MATIPDHAFTAAKNVVSLPRPVGTKDSLES